MFPPMKSPPSGGLCFALICISLSDFVAFPLCRKKPVFFVVPMLVQEFSVKESSRVVAECNDQSASYLIYGDDYGVHDSLWHRGLVVSVCFQTDPICYPLS